MSFSFLWDWKQGGDIINLTEFLYDAGQNSVDYETAGAQRQIDFGNGKTATYVQDGSYLKLREVTLAYNLPENITRGTFGSSVRYTRWRSVAGTCSGSPDIAASIRGEQFGNQAIVRNVDAAPFPPTRNFYFSVDLGF